MRTLLLSFVLLRFLAANVLAQRDPPVFECYLPSISVTHAPDSKLAVDLVFKKETGPHEHQEHQMYLLAYLKDDEQEVLKIVADVNLLDKRRPDTEQQFLEVLLEKKLAVTIDSQVAKRSGFAGQDMSGKYSDGTVAGREREQFLKLNTFQYHFTPKIEDLLKALMTLKNFNPKQGAWDYYPSKFNFLIFVPLNDSKYATAVSAEIRGKHDFPHWSERVTPKGTKLHDVTPILYCRPLPYECQFLKTEQGQVRVYIN